MLVRLGWILCWTKTGFLYLFIFEPCEYISGSKSKHKAGDELSDRFLLTEYMASITRVGRKDRQKEAMI